MVQHKKHLLPVILVALILFTLISTSSIIAQEGNPTAGLSNPLVNEEGIHTENINQSIQPYKSKAEERIDSINLWLENNASWLKIIFGMVPEISWLFAINLFLLLFFLTSLVLNGDTLFTFLSKSTSKLFGLGIFVILLVTKAFFRLAELAHGNWFGTAWYWYVIRVLAIISLIVAASVWASSRRKAREKTEKENTEIAQQVVQKTAEGITGQKP